MLCCWSVPPVPSGPMTFPALSSLSDPKLTLLLTTDCGTKRITVNAIAPGGVKTDMYIAAARLYVPNEASMTDEQVDKVCYVIPRMRDQQNILLTLCPGNRQLQPTQSCRSTARCGSRGRLSLQSRWRVDQWTGHHDRRWRSFLGTSHGTSSYRL